MFFAGVYQRWWLKVWEQFTAFSRDKKQDFFGLVVTASYTGVDNKRVCEMTRFFLPNLNYFIDSLEQTRMIKSLAVSHFYPSLVFDRICLNIKNRVKFIHSQPIKLWVKQEKRLICVANLAIRHFTENQTNVIRSFRQYFPTVVKKSGDFGWLA